MSRHLRLASLTFCALTACKTPSAADGSLVKDATGADVATTAYPGPPATTAESGDNAWSTYCVGDQQNPANIPGPNYNNNDVKTAAANLTLIRDYSFSIYGQVAALYKATPVAKPDGVSANAHQFLTYLCGEFRDRPAMVAAKIRWINRLRVLSGTTQGAIDPTQDLWSQFTAAGYGAFIDLSGAYYDAKHAALSGTNTLGTITDVERPVAALSVCETKFMVSEYVAKGQRFDDLASYQQKYEAFKPSCPADDLDYYYDFRGDSNIKPNSPESNAMIWHSISVALQCQDATHVRATPKSFGGVPQKLVLTDDQCASYFRQPFLSRWNAARAGLGTWILHTPATDAAFSNTGALVLVTPNWQVDPALRPATFTAGGGESLVDGWQGQWNQPGMGIEALLPPSAPGVDAKQIVYVHLRDALNRHTDWYASAYDDGMNQKRDRPQAYSPFVASSYEMSRSDAFTSPGYTVPSSIPDANARKHFMYVFKVRKEHWFNSDSAAAGTPVNFDSTWFDETTMGTNGLAKSERAWDRLGTPLEGELDSILYLINICTSGAIESSAQPCYTAPPTVTPTTVPSTDAVPTTVTSPTVTP